MPIQNVSGRSPAAPPNHVPSADASAQPAATAPAKKHADTIAVSGRTHPTLHDAVDRVANDVTAVAKGRVADRALPQRYRLRPMEGARNTSVAGIFDKTAGKLDRAGNPRGAYAVRFDTPHTGPGGKPLGYHLNFDTLPSGVRDPHVEVPRGLVPGAGRLSRGLEAFDKVAAPVAVVVDGARLAGAFHQDGNRIGTHTAHTAGSVAGGWAGGFIGAEAGAEGGAAIGGGIGALFGGVGAVPGAAIGGVVGGIGGGIAGALGGSSLGEKIVDLFKW